MIKKYLISGLLLILLISCNDNETNIQSSDVQADSEEVEAIRIRIDDLWKALSSQNVEDFKDNCDVEFRYFTARGGNYDIDELLNLHIENLKDFKIIISEDTVHVDDTIAWVTSNAKMNGLVEGNKWKGDFLLTTILRKQNDEWLVVHIHESQSH